MTEKQIFALIYGVEDGLKTLYDIGAFHNCINLDTILCRNGYFKVTDVSATTSNFIFNQDITSYNLVLQEDKEQFLS
jgi:hypothetical protein